MKRFSFLRNALLPRSFSRNAIFVPASFLFRSISVPFSFLSPFLFKINVLFASQTDFSFTFLAKMWGKITKLILRNPFDKFQAKNIEVLSKFHGLSFRMERKKERIRSFFRSSKFGISFLPRSFRKILFSFLPRSSKKGTRSRTRSFWNAFLHTLVRGGGGFKKNKNLITLAPTLKFLIQKQIVKNQSFS